jgi:Holliday junction DNA helicase RuvA
MYEFIQGKLVEKHPTHVVIECQGIGYGIFVSVNTSSSIDGEHCKLFTQLVVREDAMTLYGFVDRAERSMFQQLIEVSGIGPNTAIVVLSDMKASEVREAVLTGNVEAFKQVKGVGPKTAQRVIVDLKDRLEKSEALGTESENAYNSSKDEALSALTALGFEQQKARKALEKSRKEADKELAVEDLVKNALRHL